jgi:Ig-like domain CHU_C associated/Secretion system C-terminal sorting domain
MNRFVLVVIFLGLFSISFSGFGQTTGDFRSFATGNWNNTGTWERYDGAVWVNPAPNTPTSADGVITVRHNVTFDASISIDQLTINLGNTLTVSSGITLTLNNGTGNDLTFQTGFGTARMDVSGRLNVIEGAVISNASSSRLRILSGGVYEHSYSTSPGVIYTSGWLAGSTLEITGYTTPGGPPTGLGQTFETVTWNCTSQGEFIDLDGALQTVNGDLNISSSNGNFLVLTQGTAYTLAIGGNFNISGNTALAFNGFTSAVSTTIDVTGNLNYTSSAESWFSVDGDAVLNVTGNTTINSASGIDLVNNSATSSGSTIINTSGDFILTSGIIKNTTNATVCDINFSGTTDPQIFTNNGTISEQINYTIKNGSYVNLGASALTGSGTFTLEAGATMRVGSADGITTSTTTGNIRVPGAGRTYNASANIVYNGTVAQSLGNEWDSGGGLNGLAVNLEIDNTNGVTNNIVGVASVVGDLTLTNGALHIGNSNSLDVQSNFSVTSGTIGGLSTSNLTFSGGGTLDTLRMAVGASSLNNLTNSRVTTPLVLGSNLTLDGTLSLTSNLDFSGQSLTINGTSITGTAGIVGSSTSNLTISGSGFSGTIPFTGSGQLNNLSLSSGGGATYTINSAVTVNGNLNMAAGTLTHTSGLTMATNSTFVKDAGSIISNAPNAVSSYNVTYTGAGNTGLELPTSATALNDLTTNVSGIVSLQSPVTVNGDFVLTSGTFDGTTNNFTMAGANWSGNGGTYTINSGNTTIFAGTTVMGGSSPGGTFGNLTINGGASLTAPPANINVSGAWSKSGTFVANGGTVTFNGAGQTLNSSGTIFNNVVVSSGTVTLGDAMDVNGDLTISSTLDVGVGNNSINIAGTWTNNGTFTHGTGTVIFDGANQTITSSAKPFFDVTLGGSGIALLGDVLDLNGALTININAGLSTGVSNFDITLDGNWTNNGSFVANSGKVIFAGTNVQDISGSTITAFNDIDNSNSSTNGVRVETDQNLTGTLTLTTASAVFDADGSANTSVFTLVSSADNPANDGNIAALTTPANLTGEITVERYMSSEGGVWRYISAPVSGLLVSDWQTQFPITGSFTGADDLGGANLPSVYVYDEPTIDVLDSGWVAYPLAANTESVNPGLGYSAFMRSSGGQITIAQRGPVNSGNFDFVVDGNLTYTSTGAGAPNDGWNLLGNPYPSAIDWDLMWTNEAGSNLDGTMSIRDNPGSVYATWNASSNSGTNGGTKNIAIGQAFWVHATGAPALTLNETEKTVDAHEFFRTAPPQNFIRIALSDGNKRDETLIHFFDDALPGKDKYDAYKLQNDIFNLSTLMDDGSDLVINAIGATTCDTEVNLKISNINPGNYTLDFSELDSFNDIVAIYLIDNVTGAFEAVSNGYQYPFSVTSDTATFGKNRFMVRFDKPDINIDLLVSGADICLAAEASISIAATEIGVYYSANSTGIGVSDTLAGTGAELILLINSPLDLGTHEIKVAANNGCGSMALVNTATIEVTEVFAITQVVGDQTCAANTLNLKAAGAPADGTYRWYNLETDELAIAETTIGEFTTPSINESKMFFVAAVNALGCEGDRVAVEAVVVNLEIPTVKIDTLDYGVYQLASSYTQGNQWYLYGQAIDGATNSTLLITEPGIYSVIVAQSGCTVVSDDYNYDDLITGLGDELAEVGISIAPNPFVTSFELTIPADKFNLRKTSLTIFDIKGRVVYADKKVKNEYNVIDLRDIDNGIYLINIYDGELGVQYKLIKE